MIGAIVPQPITVRRGRVEDLDQLEDVYRQAYRGLEEYADTTTFRIRNYLNWLYSGEPEGFFVAEVEGRLIGFVSIHAEWWDKRLGETGEIHEICVHPEWKGKGGGAEALRSRHRVCASAGSPICEPLGGRAQLARASVVSEPGV